MQQHQRHLPSVQMMRLLLPIYDGLQSIDCCRHPLDFGDFGVRVLDQFLEPDRQVSNGVGSTLGCDSRVFSPAFPPSDPPLFSTADTDCAGRDPEPLGQFLNRAVTIDISSGYLIPFFRGYTHVDNIT